MTTPPQQHLSGHIRIIHLKVLLNQKVFQRWSRILTPYCNWHWIKGVELWKRRKESTGIFPLAKSRKLEVMNSQSRKECYRSSRKSLYFKDLSKLTLLWSPLHNVSPNPFVISSFKIPTGFAPPLHPADPTQSISLIYAGISERALEKGLLSLLPSEPSYAQLTQETF